MRLLRDWWSNDLSKWVKFTALVLLANALPLFAPWVWGSAWRLWRRDAVG